MLVWRFLSSESCPLSSPYNGAEAGSYIRGPSPQTRVELAPYWKLSLYHLQPHSTIFATMIDVTKRGVLSGGTVYNQLRFSLGRMCRSEAGMLPN